MKDVYDWPLELDPWSELDPRRPPISEDGWTPGTSPKPKEGYSAEQNPQNHRNAMTEGIRRYPAYTLVRSAYTALGWPVPDLVVPPDAPLRTKSCRLRTRAPQSRTEKSPYCRAP